MLVVTGSADHVTYIFDISDLAGTNNSTQSDVATSFVNNYTQKLTYHSDIVYGVDFHPTEPILATSSGDGTIKICILSHYSN